MSANDKNEHGEGVTRRDMLAVTTVSAGAVGSAMVVWPLIDNMNPAADTLALSSIEVDISTIEEGNSVTVKWRGKPVFIRHRTAAEVAEARADDNAEDLKDPQADAERVTDGKEQWLIMSGVCTHLGCVPVGEEGDFGGWFCPCHGSHYDKSGRIRKGPAPTNLVVPNYTFLTDTVVKIG